MFLKEKVAETLGRLPIPLEREKLAELLEWPRDRTLGDLAFPCFTLSKQMRKAPQQIAKDLELQFQPDDLIARVTAVGPYLNLFFKMDGLAEWLVPKIQDGSLCSPQPSRGERVMIEYSQPNTHKEFHVGHIRNVSLGDALVRMCRWSGFEVVAANYIGDEGAHIAKCLWVMNQRGDPWPTENRGEFLGRLYVEGAKALDFRRLARLPFPGLISAQVTGVEDHPSERSWKVVTCNLGGRSVQVVCGGVGYKVGDVVCYAPIGVRLQGRVVSAVDKSGVLSEGVICSESELDLSEEKDRIYLLPPGTAIGQEVCELTRVEPGNFSIRQEIEKCEREVSEVLKAIESGRGEVHKLWQETRRWSIEDFQKIYEWMDVHFDHYFFESEVGQTGKEIVLDYYKKGLFIQSEGAIGVDLTKYNLPFFLLLRSNGTGLYSTKDVALAVRKFKEFRIDRSIYVVDVRQSLHFQQLFRTLELIGFSQASKCHHLSYAFVEGAHGEMSSRAGTAIAFSKLKETLLTKIHREFLDPYRGEWPDEEIETAARNVAVATIRYGMLNQDNNKNIVFDLDEWTARTGNTGPYLLYAYARTASIQREVGTLTTPPQWSELVDESERQLLLRLSGFVEAILRSVERYEPQLLCIYLYDLAKEFSRMYAQCSVLKAPTEELKSARLALVSSTGKVLKEGLNLLGISTLERM